VSAMVRASNESFLENLHHRNRDLLKANRELRRAQERLIQAERLSVLGKFASLILHDIRNPIAILKGCAEMVQLAPDDRALVDRNIGRIIAEADRLNRLASEMLDFSRGDIALNVSIVDLRDLVARVTGAMAEAFATRKVEVVSRVDFAGPVVLDADRMQRALLNLADNARKAMPKGGTFTIATAKKGRHGCGRAEAPVRAVLLPFRRGRDRPRHVRGEERDRGPRRHARLDERKGEGDHVPDHAPGGGVGPPAPPPPFVP
jgi:signal transduction histidine kinase